MGGNPVLSQVLLEILDISVLGFVDVLDTHFCSFPEFYYCAQFISKQSVIYHLSLPFLLCFPLYGLQVLPFYFTVCIYKVPVRYMPIQFVSLRLSLYLLGDLSQVTYRL